MQVEASFPSFSWVLSLEYIVTSDAKNMDDIIALGFNFKFNSSHKASERKSAQNKWQDGRTQTYLQWCILLVIQLLWPVQLFSAHSELCSCVLKCTPLLAVFGHPPHHLQSNGIEIANVPAYLLKKTSYAPSFLQPAGKTFQLRRSCKHQMLSLKMLLLNPCLVPCLSSFTFVMRALLPDWYS